MHADRRITDINAASRFYKFDDDRVFRQLIPGDGASAACIDRRDDRHDFKTVTLCRFTLDHELSLIHILVYGHRAKGGALFLLAGARLHDPASLRLRDLGADHGGRAPASKNKAPPLARCPYRCV